LPNSKIIVELSYFKSSTPQTNQGVELKVIDYGIGIAENDKLNLFQPFFFA